MAEWRKSKRTAYARIARAARLRGEATRAEWYEARSKTLAVPWGERAEQCGQWRELALTCKTCGSVEVRPLACGLRHWCPSCALDRSRREYARLRRALETRVREERSRWYRAGFPRHHAPQLRILTLTVRDGDLEATRALIAKSWPKLRRWLHSACGYAPPFAAVWEVTEGSTARGHAHLHIVAVLPFLPVRELAAAWVQATHEAAEAQGLDLTTVTPTAGAKYVAAYVTAAGLDEDLPVQIAAAWTRASFGRRLIHTSAGFWVPPERHVRCDCGTCEAPRVTVHRRATYGTINRGSRGPPGEQTQNINGIPASRVLH